MNKTSQSYLAALLIFAFAGFMFGMAELASASFALETFGYFSLSFFLVGAGFTILFKELIKEVKELNN